MAMSSEINEKHGETVGKWINGCVCSAYMSWKMTKNCKLCSSSLSVNSMSLQSTYICWKRHVLLPWKMRGSSYPHRWQKKPLNVLRGCWSGCQNQRIRKQPVILPVILLAAWTVAFQPIIQHDLQESKMWERYYKLHSSEGFVTRWAEFLQANVGSEACPIFYQFVTDSIMKVLIKKHFPI